MLPALEHRKLMVIIVAMRVRKKMKFVIGIPTTYSENVEIDKINGNKYRQDSNNK